MSLNDYLNIAALCYEAVFGGKTKGLTGEKMYRKWADGRDCGMLKIKNAATSRAVIIRPVSSSSGTHFGTFNK